MTQQTSTLNFMSGNGLNAHNGNAGDATTELVTRMRSVVEGTEFNQAIDVEVRALYNRSIDSSLGLPNDVILITVSEGDFRATIPIHLVTTAVCDIGERVITINGHAPLTTKIPKFPSEVHCPIFEDIIRRVTAVNNIDPNNCVVSQSVVLQQAPEDMSDADVADIVGRAIMRTFTTLKVELAHDLNEFTIGEINSNHGSNLHVNVAFDREAVRYDDMGIHSAAATTLTLTTSDGTTQGEGMIRPSSTSEVGTVRIRGSVVASSAPVMHPKDPNNQPLFGGPTTGAAYYHSFTPQIIVEEVGMGGHDSFSKYLLMLAHSALVVNNDMIPKMYSKSSLAGLNFRCNLLHSDTPEPLDIETCVEAYDQVFKAMFTETAMLSLVVRPGSWDYEYSQWFLKAAEGDKKAMDFINSKLNILLGNGDGSFANISLVQPMYEEYLVGIYTHMDAADPSTPGVVRPLSEIDLMWLNTYMPGNEEVLHKWVTSQSTALPDEGLALKEQVLHEATNHTYNIMDRRFLLTFTPQALDLFADIRRRITLLKYDNFASYQQVEHSVWSGHIHAAASVSYAQASSVGSYGTTQPYQQSAGGYNNGYNRTYR